MTTATGQSEPGKQTSNRPSRKIGPSASTLSTFALFVVVRLFFLLDGCNDVGDFVKLRLQLLVFGFQFLDAG
jgi:hypothetical protein